VGGSAFKIRSDLTVLQSDHGETGLLDIDVDDASDGVVVVDEKTLVQTGGEAGRRIRSGSGVAHVLALSQSGSGDASGQGVALLGGGVAGVRSVCLLGAGLLADLERSALARLSGFADTRSVVASEEAGSGGRGALTGRVGGGRASVGVGSLGGRTGLFADFERASAGSASGSGNALLGLLVARVDGSVVDALLLAGGEGLALSGASGDALEGGLIAVPADGALLDGEFTRTSEFVILLGNTSALGTGKVCLDGDGRSRAPTTFRDSNTLGASGSAAAHVSGLGGNLLLSQKDKNNKNERDNSLHRFVFLRIK
jgi:hypothetical protein